jgi:uncharacterized protein YciI
MFIIQLTYVRPLAEVDQLLEDHKQFLTKHYEEGAFLLSGRRDPRTGGIILAQADSKEEIEKIIAEDPFNRHGLAEYSITEFKPTMANETLQPLLK